MKPIRIGLYSTELNRTELLAFLAIFKNVAHSLAPGETPSNSASHQAPNYVQRSFLLQNTLKRCVAVAVRCVYFFQFTYDQDCTMQISRCRHTSESTEENSAISRVNI